MKAFLLGLILFAGALPVALASDRAASAYKAGVRAEKKSQIDAAFQAYKTAHDLKPLDALYSVAYLRLRSEASNEHIQAAQRLYNEGNLQGSFDEFRVATQIDPSNFEAAGWLRRVSSEVELRKRDQLAASKPKQEETRMNQAVNSAAGPIELKYKADVPVSISMSTTADVLYKTIGKLGGLNVLIDPDYKPQKLTFELKDVTLRQALDMLSVQSKTFWRPLSPNTILVTADTSAKHKELDQSVMKTFYLRNASTPEQLQAAAGTLKGILDISHVQVTPEMRSLTLRGTPDQMIFAQKLLTDIDKARAEVIVEIVVMEVNRNTLRTFGTTLPTSISAQIQPAGSSSTVSGSNGNSLTLSSFPNLSSNDIAVSVSGASFTALETDANTKVIQRPQMRVVDDQKASLKIGDRIPIATGSFQSGLTQGVNTQFQYIDVGVNVDITPHVHGNNEVTLKLSLEISSVTGEQTISGVTEPTIGQRRIEHETRLADGEVNLIAGILQDSEAKSLSGWPLLSKIPILKYLFAQDSKQRNQSEIVFAVIPHIIRSNPVTDDDLRMVDLGSPSTVKYRSDGKEDPAPKAAEQSGPASQDRKAVVQQSAAAAQDRKPPVPQNPPASVPRSQ
jgi:general secretion pathway protein D